MGIRPAFKFLVGVDDVVANDPRRSLVPSVVIEELQPIWYVDDENMDLTDLLTDLYPENRKITYGQDWNVLDDILYNVKQPGEYVCGNIVGLVYEKSCYDDSIIRALATVDEKYMVAGFMRIPTLDPSQHQIHFKRNRYTDDDVACNRFVPSVFENSPEISRMLWSRAEFYLKQAGWNIKQAEMRYLLVWDWS